MNALSQEIDRLVDGELSEAARMELLKRLDRDPEGWRQCALAFLEDQALRDVLKPAMMPLASLPSKRKTHELLKIAAAILTAFALGWTARPGSSTLPAVVQNKSDAPALKTDLPNSKLVQVALKQPAIVDPEAERLRSWEQAGFTVSQSERLLQVGTEDGRSLTVPVNEYRFEYIGDRMY